LGVDRGAAEIDDALTLAVCCGADAWLHEVVPRQLARARGAARRGHLDSSAVERIVQKAATRAGIVGKVSPHWLRHAHPTHALERQCPMHLVQATLGHASVATTGRYLHARPTDSSARYLAV